MLYIMAICLISSYLPMFKSTRNFYIMTITLLLIVVLPVMQIILDQNPIVWMFYFIFNKTSKVHCDYYL